MKLSYPHFFKPPPGTIRIIGKFAAEDPNCQSRLIGIPTGLGKTLGVFVPDSGTP